MSNKDKLRYSMLIEWDDESQCYLVTLPEWIGYTNGQHIVDCKTYTEAAKKGEEILASLVEVSKREDDEMPEPQTTIYPAKDYSVGLEWENDHYDVWVARSGRPTGGTGYCNVGRTREEALHFADNIMKGKPQ